MTETIIAWRHNKGGKSESTPQIPNYRLHRKFGCGAMGVVYLARGVDCSRCAVKLARTALAGDPLGGSRFVWAADVLERVTLPHIARLLDVGETEMGSPYLVTEHVAGQNLDRIVRRHGPLSVERVQTVLDQACAALSAVHACGFVHNDINSANIMTTDKKQRLQTTIELSTALK